MRKSRSLRFILLLALLLPAATSLPVTQRTASATTSADDMARFMFGYLNQFWFRVFFGHDEIDYEILLEYYFFESGSDWIPVHRCPVKVPDDNAVYCPSEQVIFMDRDFIEPAVEGYGVESVAFIMAHEWGHHIEWIIFPDAGALYAEFRTELELIADCFAGASIAPLVLNGTFSRAQLENMRAYIYYVLGDNKGRDVAIGVLDHGTSDMRLGAFDLGLDQGPAACVV